MQITPEDKTIIGLFTSWIAAVVAGVRGYSKLTARVDDHGKELVDIRHRLNSPDGEPLLVSVRMHEKARKNDRYVIEERCRAFGKRLNDHDKNITQVVNDIAEIKKAISVLDTKMELLLEIREGGRRKHDV